MSIASKEDLDLIQKLIDRGLVDKNTLMTMLAAQKQAYEKQKSALSGTLFLLDIEIQEMQILELTSDKELDHLVFPESDYRQGDWESWGSDLTLLDEQEGLHQASWKPVFGEPYGLVMADNGSYLYMPNGLKAPWLGYTQTCLHGQVHKGLVQTSPYDLYLAPNQQLLGISNRGEGSIEVISTRNFESVVQAKIRKPGSSDTLNQAFDIKRQKLFVTDNQSVNLFEIDLKNGKTTVHKPGFGQLGNLVMAPDGEHIYLLTQKPSQELLYLKTTDLSITKKIRIKGELYKNKSNAPCDLLSLSPDGALLVLMTYQNSPEPFTPVITIIDALAAKTLRRYAIKDGSHPIQLLFQRPNPLGAYSKKTLQDMLVETGLVDKQILNQILTGPAQPIITSHTHPSNFQTPQEFIPPQPYAPLSPPSAAPTPPQTVLQRSANTPSPPAAPQSPATQNQVPIHRAPGTQPLRPEDLPAPEPTISQKLEAQVPEVAPLNLGPESIHFIQELLAERFQQHYLLDLRDNNLAMERLKTEAERVREKLQSKNSIDVLLKKLLQGRSLDTTVYRRQLLLKQEEQAFIDNYGQVTLPLNCPMCQQNLMNSWECNVCGFEVENPQRAFLRQVSSADATSGFIPGNFLLSDPEGLRLLELDTRKEIQWHLDPDQLSCEYPIDAVKLPNQNFLVADLQRHQIYEIGSRGKIFWSLKIFDDDRLRLKDPVRVTWYRPTGASDEDLRYLIVDQGNHRVIEVDQSSTLHREFGIQGEAGEDAQHLCGPTDVQLTPDRTWLICDAENGRVLEFNAQGQIEQEFTRSEYGLVRPSFARRLWNGTTLIVDSEAFQILELNPRGIVTERISYYKTGMPMEMRLVNPTQMVRLPNQDIVLVNRHKAIQILPLQKKLLWYSALDKIQIRTEKPEPPQPALFRQETPAESQPLKPERPKPIEPKIAIQTQAPPAVPQNQHRRPQTGQLISPEERLQALIAKRPAPVNQESYEHSIVYTHKDVHLQPATPCLIDKRHNGVICINRKGKVLWHYGYEMGQALASPGYVQQHQHSLIIADALHDRILEISRNNKDHLLEIKGPKDSPLSRPRSAQKLDSGNFLIADQQNKRLVEISPSGQIVWSFQDENLLLSPYYAETLPDGHVLYVDTLRKRVVQIDREGNVQWYYGRPLPGDLGAPKNRLFGPQFATRLKNGNTLIADTHHHRVLEVNPQGETVWEYIGQARSNRLNPLWAERMDNGNTLIAFSNYSVLVELTPLSQSVWSYTLGKDVFLPPVEGDTESLVHHESEELKPFYNPIEKRRINTARNNNQDVVEAHIELMDNLQMKSVRAQLIMMEMERHGQVFKSFPAPEDLMADRFGKHLIIVCMLNRQEDHKALQRSIENIAEVVQVTIKELNV